MFMVEPQLHGDTVLNDTFFNDMVKLLKIEDIKATLVVTRGTKYASNGKRDTLRVCFGVFCNGRL